jgi:hypothetical protein
MMTVVEARRFAVSSEARRSGIAAPLWHTSIWLPHELPAAMVAKVLCNLTPRHPPSQVLDNLPEIAG